MEKIYSTPRERRKRKEWDDAIVEAKWDERSFVFAQFGDSFWQFVGSGVVGFRDKVFDRIDKMERMDLLRGIFAMRGSVI